jgi:DNA-binding beta-propeller fold protein YncE
MAIPSTRRTSRPGTSRCSTGPRGSSRHLWVANQSAGNITVIDTKDNTVAYTLPCPGVPLRIRFAAGGRLCLVANWEEKGELVVLEASDGSEVDRLPVGNQPIGLELTPSEDRVFVSNMSSDDVHCVDLDALEVVARFETGKGPDYMRWWSGPPG